MARNKYNVDEDLEVGFNLSYLKRLISYMKPYKVNNFSYLNANIKFNIISRANNN